MDITPLSVAQKYAAARPATEPTHIDTPNGEFIPSAIQSFENTLKNSEALARTAMTSDADPHALVQALAQTELAVETAVTIRNRVVEAYQEILRMPV